MSNSQHQFISTVKTQNELCQHTDSAYCTICTKMVLIKDMGLNNLISVLRN